MRRVGGCEEAVSMNQHKILEAMLQLTFRFESSIPYIVILKEPALVLGTLLIYSIFRLYSLQKKLSRRVTPKTPSFAEKSPASVNFGG